MCDGNNGANASGVPSPPAVNNNAVSLNSCIRPSAVTPSDGSHLHCFHGFRERFPGFGITSRGGLGICHDAPGKCDHRIRRRPAECRRAKRVRGIRPKQSTDHRPACSQRSSRPPDMQRGNMPMANRFFPPRMGGNPLDGQVHFDKALGIGGGHSFTTVTRVSSTFSQPDSFSSIFWNSAFVFILRSTRFAKRSKSRVRTNSTLS